MTKEVSSTIQHILVRKYIYAYLLSCMKSHLKKMLFPESTFKIKVMFAGTLFLILLTVRRRNLVPFYQNKQLLTRFVIMTFQLNIYIYIYIYIFLIATLVFARQLLDEIYHLIELSFE